MHKFFALILFSIVHLNNAAVISRNEDASFWRNVGIKQLKKTLLSGSDKEIQKARNIIICVGDGMGPTTVTAGRIYKGQLKGKSGEEETLIFEDFPHTGLAKTYNVDKQVPDSAGTATALFTGVKTRYGVISMDASTTPIDAQKGRLESIMDWAVKAGKRTGIVTTTRITHATPASLYAKIHNRDWECDTEMSSESIGVYKDIARQLVQESPGNQFNVILGGGLSALGDHNQNETSTVQFEGSTEEICKRQDGRNLTDEWLKSKPSNASLLVKTRDQLMSADTTNLDFLMGLFRNNHITYSIARQPGEPSLSEMVQQAIGVLDRKDSNGYVLVIEGGRIDQAHHQNYARAALQEVVEFDAAVQLALKLTNSADTLLIVTADHSHALTLNGYPLRGNDILGFANKSQSVLAYETLTYANGPGFWDHRINATSTNASHYGTWIPVDKLSSDKDRSSPTYRHLATFPLEDETHGGEDVAVYALGPGANLIRGTFEQNYLAYVTSYATCIGPVAYMNKGCGVKSAANNLEISYIFSLALSCLVVFKI